MVKVKVTSAKLDVSNYDDDEMPDIKDVSLVLITNSLLVRPLGMTVSVFVAEWCLLSYQAQRSRDCFSSALLSPLAAVIRNNNIISGANLKASIGHWFQTRN